jgi:predicted metal-dependent phosphoesterase TrpH
MTGRPHFAADSGRKGLRADLRQAFDDYLDESAKGYVFRQEPQFAEGVARIRKRRRHRVAGASDARARATWPTDARTVRLPG